MLIIFVYFLSHGVSHAHTHTSIRLVVAVYVATNRVSVAETIWRDVIAECFIHAENRAVN